jgi:hypothetical protein
MAETALATLNGLMTATQAEVELPEPTQALLSRKTVVIRRIPASTYRALFPFLPAAVVDGGGPEEAALTDKERLKLQTERELHWLETAPSAERVKYRVDLEQVKFRALALCLVEPRMTEAEVERLGDEIQPVFIRLLEISGLRRKPEPEPAVEAAAG